MHDVHTSTYIVRCGRCKKQLYITCYSCVGTIVNWHTMSWTTGGANMTVIPLLYSHVTSLINSSLSMLTPHLQYLCSPTQYSQLKQWTMSQSQGTESLLGGEGGQGGK